MRRLARPLLYAGTVGIVEAHLESDLEPPAALAAVLHGWDRHPRTPGSADSLPC
jgi:hypothetical protein